MAIAVAYGYRADEISMNEGVLLVVSSSETVTLVSTAHIKLQLCATNASSYMRLVVSSCCGGVSLTI